MLCLAFATPALPATKDKSLLAALDASHMLSPADASDNIVSNQVTYSGANACTKAAHHLTDVRESVLAFAPMQDVLWPGALVQGTSLITGRLDPIATDRANATIVLLGLSPKDSKPVKLAMSIKAPSLASATNAATRLIAGHQSMIAPAQLSYQTFQFYSQDQAMINIGASVSWLGGSASGAFNRKDYSERSNFIVKFDQIYYTMAFDPPHHAGDVFGSNVKLGDLNNQFEPVTNPAAYISTITYGRMLLLIMSSGHDESSSRLALDAAVKWATGKASASLSADESKIIDESDLSLIVRGGNADTAIVLSGSDKTTALGAYLRSGAQFSAQSPGVAVAYQARWLRSNKLAKIGLVGDYERNMGCSEAPFKAYKMEFRFAGDDKDKHDKVFVQLLQHGVEIARVNESGYDEVWSDTEHNPRSAGFEPPSGDGYHSRCGEMRLRIEKRGDDGNWSFGFQLWGQYKSGEWVRIGQKDKIDLKNSSENIWEDALSCN